MQFLKANAAIDVLIGPFVDSTDGATPETGLTLDVELSKNGQALANKSDATTPTHDAAGTVDGFYNCELDATDVNTEGCLVLVAFAAGALTVRHEYMVLAEAAYDSMFAAKDTGFMDVNLKAVSEDTAAADNLESACDNYSVTRGLTGTALPAAAADAAGGLPISDNGGLALDTQLANTHEITAARMGALTDWIDAGRLDVILDAILADTNELQTDWTDGGRLDLILDSAASAGDPWATALPGGYGAGTAGEIIGDLKNGERLDLIFDAILADTNELQGDWVNAGRLDAILDIIAVDVAGLDGDAMRGTNSAATAADLATAQADLDIITGATGVNLLAATQASVDAIETDTDTTIPGLIAALNDPTVGAIADAVWDEVLTGGSHNVEDSAGRRLRDLQEFGVYEDGAIWIDTINGSAGTTDYESGTVFNPVDSIADANTLAASLGISRFRLAPGSSITFAASQQNQVFIGTGWTLALGSQNIDGSSIVGASVSGIATRTAGRQAFFECVMGAVTLPANTLIGRGSTVAGTQTVGEAGDFFYDGCFSGIAGTSTPVFDFGGAIGNTNLSFRHYSGGIQLENMGDTGTDTMSLEGHGQLVEGTCTGGVVAIRGNFTVSGITNLTLSDDARIDVDQINAEVDTALSDIKLDHLVAVADADDAVDDSIMAKIAAGDGDWSTFVSATDALQAIRDQGDAAWVTGAGGDPWGTALPGGYAAGTAGGILGAWKDGERLDLLLDAIPTTAMRGTDNGATAAALATAQTDLDTITGATGVNLLAATQASIDAIEADTDELQTDWADGGRLDLLLDAIPITAMRGTDDAATEAKQDIIDTNLDAVLADTGTDGVVISATTANQLADALLKRDWSSVSGEAARSALNALRFLRNKWSIAGATLTVTEEDDSTEAWTATVSTDAAAEPVTGNDPA